MDQYQTLTKAVNIMKIVLGGLVLLTGIIMTSYDNLCLLLCLPTVPVLVFGIVGFIQHQNVFNTGSYVLIILTFIAGLITTIIMDSTGMYQYDAYRFIEYMAYISMVLNFMIGIPLIICMAKSDKLKKQVQQIAFVYPGEIAPAQSAPGYLYPGEKAPAPTAPSYVYPGEKAPAPTAPSYTYPGEKEEKTVQDQPLPVYPAQQENQTFSYPGTSAPDAPASEKPPLRTAEWTCPKCGRINAHYVGTCGCGERKPGLP